MKYIYLLLSGVFGMIAISYFPILTFYTFLGMASYIASFVFFDLFVDDCVLPKKNKKQ